MPDDLIVFSRPYRSAREAANLEEVLSSGHVHGDGRFTAAASALVSDLVGGGTTLLTTSCTHALEMASILSEIGPGDEVILPSFTFSSAATAIALRGAQIVFADIDPLTGNTSADIIEPLITARTKAISVVHYAGVGADIERIAHLARDRGLLLIEDNAHGLGGTVGGRRLGSFGDFATQSFHDTKNIHCGEGGALVINNDDHRERAEIIREKGTNRSRFLRGQVDKYTWVDIGSSFLPSELNAAVLESQLREFDDIQARRFAIWDAYAAGLADWADGAGVDLMHIPDGHEHTAHMFYLLMPDHDAQIDLLGHLRSRGVVGTFHYGALDASLAGRRYGTAPTPCVAARDFSERIVRLPLWAGMTGDQIGRVIEASTSFTVRGAVTA
jgi:dTDP-4-amino-4,6-dideoxygalactose transaminase